MVFSPTVHIALIAVGLVGIVVLGLAFRKEQTWPAVMLWVVPITLTLSAADGALALLSGPWPRFAMDGGSGDWLRFAVAGGVLLPPIEILYQRLVTTLSGRGVTYRPASGSDESR